jgi:hypothetical protein
MLGNISETSGRIVNERTFPLAAEGYPVERDDLATITPYIQHTIRRMGDLVLNLAPPDALPATPLLAARHHRGGDPKHSRAESPR